MNTFISLLKGLFTIVWKLFILVVFAMAKVLEVISKAIGDGVQENLKSK